MIKIFVAILFAIEGSNAFSHLQEETPVHAYHSKALRDGTEYFNQNPMNGYGIGIDVENFVHNAEHIKKVLSGTKLCGVLKGDAYGHGVQILAPAVVDIFDMYCVADNSEIQTIRALNIRKPIVRIKLASFEEIQWAVVKNLDVEEYISSFSIAEKLSRLASSLGIVAKIHLSLNSTQFGRDGFNVRGRYRESSLKDIARIAKLPNISIVGISAHLPQPWDLDFQPTEKLISQFIDDANEIKTRVESGGHSPILSVANSAVAFRMKEEQRSQFSYSRVGSALYGFNAFQGQDLSELKQVVNVWAVVSSVLERESGDSIGYGFSYTVEAPTKIAILPIGDLCISHKLEKKGFFYDLNGNKFRILAVTMNTTVIEAVNSDGVELLEGDRVFLLSAVLKNQYSVAQAIDAPSPIPVTIKLNACVASRYPLRKTESCNLQDCSLNRIE